MRDQPRAFVIGDIVKADTQIAPIDPTYDFPERQRISPSGPADEVAWEADDLAVVRGVY